MITQPNLLFERLVKGASNGRIADLLTAAIIKVSRVDRKAWDERESQRLRQEVYDRPISTNARHVRRPSLDTYDAGSHGPFRYYGPALK